jgi:hypothetical protein
MNKFFGIYILSFLFFSCSSDLDFDQINDLKLEPVFVANMANFDIKANQFVIGGVEQPLVGDVMNFEVFNDKDFSRNLNKTEMYFEFVNTINRAYNINVYFLGANDVRLYTIPFSVPAYSGVSNPVTKTEIFENAKLDLLKKTQKIALVIAMFPGPPLTDSSVGSLKMRSSGTLYFLVE